MTLPEVFRARASEDHDIDRVDRWIVAHMPGVTRASVQRWIEDGRVLVDGTPCRAKDKIRPGMVVEVRPDLPPPTTAVPDPSVIVDVVFEDDYLIVVNKPAGLVVHPGRGHVGGTLVNGLLARPGFERPPVDPRDEAGHFRPGIVHRIDKDTSGLLVVAKTEHAREHLKEQLAAHTVVRSYEGISVGVPPEGRIASLHGRDPRSRLRFSCRVSHGKVAITHVKVLERLGNGEAASVECRLETGRTHQIRVHLSQHTRTPLLGDELYGGVRGDSRAAQIGRQLGRQALHAKILGFRHPVTERDLHFEVPLPGDMKSALDALRMSG